MTLERAGDEAARLHVLDEQRQCRCGRLALPRNTHRLLDHHEAAAIELAFGPPLTDADADGKGKVLLVQAFCVLFGTIALGSLYRTVRAWRRLPRKEELS